MTAIDRLRAAIHGGDPGQTVSFGTDIAVVSLDALASARSGGQAVIVRIESPLTRALRSGTPLYERLAQDPAAGNELLDSLVAATKADIQAALGAGADGIAYIVDGAFPATSTPMQYGGFLLERDREILTGIGGEFNTVIVAGADEPYIDFVSDLPAAIFAWDAASGWTPDQVRELRTGTLAADHPEAGIQFPSAEFQSAVAAKETAPQP